MTDADQDAVRQLALEQAIQLRFALLIERRAGLIHKQQCRFDQQGTGKGDALLFADAQDLRPRLGIVEAGGKAFTPLRYETKYVNVK